MVKLFRYTSRLKLRVIGGAVRKHGTGDTAKPVNKGKQCSLVRVTPAAACPQAGQAVLLADKHLIPPGQARRQALPPQLGSARRHVRSPALCRQVAPSSSSRFRRKRRRAACCSMGLRGSRHRTRRHQPRIWPPGRDAVLSDRPFDRAARDVHRLRASRQAAYRLGGPAHEGGHHGARRPLPGNRVRRRRSRHGRCCPSGGKVRQRRAGLRRADAFLRAGTHLQPVRGPVRPRRRSQTGRRRPGPSDTAWARRHPPAVCKPWSGSSPMRELGGRR